MLAASCCGAGRVRHAGQRHTESPSIAPHGPASRKRCSDPQRRRRETGRGRAATRTGPSRGGRRPTRWARVRGSARGRGDASMFLSSQRSRLRGAVASLPILDFARQAFDVALVGPLDFARDKRPDGS